MAKYIDLPNLKENLTNFLNKKINPIYAKKTEIPSNVSELNNDKSYQTAEEVGQAVTDGVARIVAGAPEDFDTLKEMSDWISSHETSAAAMNSAISDNSVAIANHTSNSDIHVTKEEKTKWDNKVDSVNGKVLSNNNFLYKYKDTLDKMPTTYQYKTHYNKKDGTFNMVSINAGSQGTDPQTFQKYTLPSNYKDIFDGVNSKIEDLALNGVYSNKANIDEVNSNLTDLKVNEVAGGKNLIDYSKCKLGYWIQDITGLIKPKSDCYVTEIIPIEPNTTYTISGTSSSFRVEFDENLNSLMENYETDTTFTTKPTARYIRFNSYIEDQNDGTLYNHPQLEKGNVKTPYEPYLPSVKMLAYEVNQQKNDLDMLEFGEVAGGKNLATVEIPFISNNKIIFTKKDDSTLIANGGNYNDGIGISKKFLAKAGITYTAQIITDLQLGLFIWNSDEEIVVTPTTHNKEITFSVTKDTNISIAIIDDINVTFNNTEIKIQLEEGTVATDYEPYIPSVKMLADEVSAQKNDLDKLNSLPIGSIIQIEEDKDDIETTTQKYGWQYLGKSKIEYENGSIQLLVTNVYRKNN